VPDRDPDQTAEAPATTLADKIEWLITNLWPADAPPPRNNVEAAAAITAATGEEISSTTVWKLRTGRQDNPQLRTLTAFATFFGVPLGYFGFPDESAAIQDDLTFKSLRREVHSGTIDPAVLRALVELSPGTRRIVGEMILAAASADRMAHHG
jgi:transcriptional regulator with XRE-family HTH domain